MPYIKWNEDKTNYDVWYGPSMGPTAMQLKGYEKVDTLPELPTPVVPLDRIIFSKYKVAQKLMELGLWDTLKNNLTDEQKEFLYLARDFTMNDPIFKAMYDQLKPTIPNIDDLLRECELVDHI
jgi:hypothetical protein